LQSWHDILVNTNLKVETPASNREGITNDNLPNQWRYIYVFRIHSIGPLSLLNSYLFFVIS